jgi:hypothetical protein
VTLEEALKFLEDFDPETDPCLSFGATFVTGEWIDAICLGHGISSQILSLDLLGGMMARESLDRIRSGRVSPSNHTQVLIATLLKIRLPKTDWGKIRRTNQTARRERWAWENSKKLSRV